MKPNTFMAIAARNARPTLVRVLKTAIASSVLVCFLAGCATPPHRASQYSSYYETLAEPKQKRLSNGIIEVGDSRKDVYIAMGPPDLQSVPADGSATEIWDYRVVKNLSQGLPDGQFQFQTFNDADWGFGDSGLVRLSFDGNTLKSVELTQPPRDWAPGQTSGRFQVPNAPDPREKVGRPPD